MIFAEKLIKLRKQQGWSQEELASQLDVTRQSVSKWESMASIPDLDKIIKLSRIFGVSTDYLLKDENEMPEEELIPAEVSEAQEQIRKVSIEEANGFLEQTRRSAAKIAAGVSMCTMCPVPLIILAGLAEQTGGEKAENLAAGLGIGILLIMIAVAVAFFICEGFNLKKYEYLELDSIVTEYGVAGIAERKREAYEPMHRRAIIAGVCCCILAAVPLIVIGTICGDNDMLTLWMVALLLALVAGGVFLLVHSSIIWESLEKLLEEGDYTREKKRENRKNDIVAEIYWGAATAVYLAWSFITFRWERTWIIWPVAGVLYGVIIAIITGIRNRKAMK